MEREIIALLIALTGLTIVLTKYFRYRLRVMRALMKEAEKHDDDDDNDVLEAE